MNENEKVRDWAWQLYTKFIVAHDKKLDAYCHEIFEMCLEHAEYARKVSRSFFTKE
jgi:hypothetical protein